MKSFVCLVCGKTSYSSADPEHQVQPRCPYCHSDMYKKTLTDERKLELIDEYLEEPNNLNREWVEMLTQLREQILSNPKVWAANSGRI